MGLRKLLILTTVGVFATSTLSAPQLASAAAPAPASTSPGFDPAAFADPPNDSRPTVLWFWNGTVTNDLIDRQLADLRQRGVYNAVIFPFQTSALKPAFLSDGWFDVVGHALDEAKRTGMRVWLFNDDFFPSGRAASLVVNGGRVSGHTYAPHPELAAKSLARQQRTVTGPATVSLVPSGLDIENGRLIVDAASLQGVRILKVGSDWSDYTVTAHRRSDSGAAGIVVRAADENNGYLVDTNQDGSVFVYRQAAGSFQQLATSPPIAGFAAGDEHEIRIDLRGNTITTAIDDFAPHAGGAPVDVVGASARPAGSSGGLIDLTKAATAGGTWQAPAGTWTLDTFTASRTSGSYLDLMSDDAVARFMDAVPGEYYRHFPDAFGTVIRGFWDDEPTLTGTPWSPSLPDALARFGTSPGLALTGVFDDLGRAGRTLRGDYWRAVSDRFAEAYYHQQATWMGEHRVGYISNPLHDEFGPAGQLDV